MKKILGTVAASFLCLAVAALVVTAPTQDTPNLALNKYVRASSTYGQASWSPDFVVDGIRTEKSGARGWSSQGDTSVNHPEWIMIDLGASHPVNRVDLYPRNASQREGESFPIDFTIQTSLDGNAWKTVVSRNGYGKPGPEPQRFTFDKTDARYVKVEGTNLRYLGAESAYYMQFAEIEIYGPSAAAEEEKKPVLAPSSWAGEIAMDGGGTQSLRISIGSDNQISGEITQSRTGRAPERYAVSGSLNPQTGAIAMSYSTRAMTSITEGTLTGKIDSPTEASGTIAVKVTLVQVARKTATTNGTWRLTRR
jgi:hypothetical protein